MSRATDIRHFKVAVEIQQKCIAAVHMNALALVQAVSVGRDLDTDTLAIERILVSAACRSLEMLIEKQHGAITGMRPLSVADQQILRQTIVIQAVDLKAVLIEAGAAMDKLMVFSDNLTKPIPPEQVQ